MRGYVLRFEQNPNQSNIYDLVDGQNLGFDYLKMTPPQKNFLIKKGVVHVLESWRNDAKVIFAGLLKLPRHKGYYYSNSIDTSNGKKSLLCCHINSEQSVLYLLIFPHFDKYNNKQRIKYLSEYLRNENNKKRVARSAYPIVKLKTIQK